MAAFAMALPIFLAVAKTAFQRCDPALEDAARTLNAGRLRAFATVTLPLAAPGLLAAAAVSFARAFGEFGATIMLAGNVPGHTQTVSQGIYTDLMAGRDSAAWGLVLVSVAVGITAMVASQLLIARPKPTAGGEGGQGRCLTSTSASARASSNCTPQARRTRPAWVCSARRDAERPRCCTASPAC